jgi:hypothetical protein
MKGAASLEASGTARPATKSRKHQLPKQSADSGFPIGRLWIDGFLSDDEFNTGATWAELTYKLAKHKGLTLPRCRAVGLRRQRERILSENLGTSQLRRLEEQKVAWDRVIIAADREGPAMMLATIIQEEEPRAPARLKRVLRLLLKWRIAIRLSG